MEQIQKEIDIQYAILKDSNVALKRLIKFRNEELKQLQNTLYLNEKIYYDYIDKLKHRLAIESERIEIIEVVKKLKKQVHDLYINGDFDELVVQESSWTTLEEIFVGNRFCTYFRNDTNAGFYPNEGVKFDPNWYIESKPHIAGKNEVIFDNYKAFEIAGFKKSKEERFNELMVMFDNFLNDKEVIKSEDTPVQLHSLWNVIKPVEKSMFVTEDTTYFGKV